jgi:GTP-binding protein Era
LSKINVSNRGIMKYKSGFIAVLGRTNVGKSTFINNCIGEKVSIISNKPQTTRNTIQAVLTKDDYQMVFLDTPGFHKPKNELSKRMIDAAKKSVDGADGVLLIIEAQEKSIGKGDLFIIDILKNLKIPVFLIINKIDLIEKDRLLKLISEYSACMDFHSIIPVSALKGDGIGEVIKELSKILKEGPKYFPDDIVTDQPERMVTGEIIREKLMRNLSDEVPHGIGVEINSFKERKDKKIIDIDATVYCERTSHKKIIIGKKGDVLKKIGTLARTDIERLLAEKVNLKIWVKVKDDWRNKESMLRSLGY